MEKKEFLYYIDKDRFVLSDLSQISESERTFDLVFFDFANNKLLLDKLNLVSMYCNTENGVKWFAHYLADFSSADGMVHKLLSNPILRLLIMDADLLKEIELILNK